MMKLAILGATGRTGVHLVEQALEEGHEVVAIVRTPSKVTTEHENLKVSSTYLRQVIAYHVLFITSD